MKKIKTFRLSTELLDALQAEADRQNRSLNFVVEDVLQRNTPYYNIIQCNTQNSTKSVIQCNTLSHNVAQPKGVKETVVSKPSVEDVLIDETGTVPDITLDEDLIGNKESILEQIEVLQAKIACEKHIIDTQGGMKKIEAQVRKIALEKELAKKLKEKRTSS